MNMDNDVEYISSKVRPNGLNIEELISKNIPPLTDFEEEYIANRLMVKCPPSCLMLDAQLFLHNEAMAVVKKNYRLKVMLKVEYEFQWNISASRIICLASQKI